MKRKILALVTASILALTCFATVTAADKSVTKAEKWIEAGKHMRSGAAFASDDVDAEIGGFGTEGASLVSILAHLAAQYPKYDLVGGFSVIYPESSLDEAAEVVLSSGYIEPNKSYVLGHMDPNTGEWDLSSAGRISVKSGIARFTVTKSGPYALLEVKNNSSTTQPSTTTQNVANNKPAAAANKPAPKTGEI